MKRKKAKVPARTPDELVALAREHTDRGELAEAEARYREALALAPDHAGLLTLLGLLLVDRGSIDAAVETLEHARDLAPAFAPVQLAIGSAYAAAGHDDLAITAMETAIKLDASSTIPLERLARHHIVAGRPREAIGLLRRILRRDPAHAQARFLLAGLTGEAVGIDRLDAPPSDLIADLFDSYAPSFDEHLVERLGYTVPQSLAALVAAAGASRDGSLHVIDLGCGTGLAGIEFRPYARSLVGSDLSPRMIERARQRNLYDELHVEDLVATLVRAREVDLVVAADVLLYLGSLEATFAASAEALRAGGLFAFSVERGNEGEDFVLRSTLRYAHDDAYVQRLARAHGFAVVSAEASVLRLDHGNPIHGMLYVLRRP